MITQQTVLQYGKSTIRCEAKPLSNIEVIIYQFAVRQLNDSTIAKISYSGRISIFECESMAGLTFAAVIYSQKQKSNLFRDIKHLGYCFFSNNAKYWKWKLLYVIERI